jgi:3-phenylpropionate/trans-cinnamate dioxygenase ferredoxin component
MSDPAFTPVAASVDLPDDGQLAVRACGTALLLVRHEGTLFALENICSHVAEPLSCGRVRHGWIACPAHGARFDLATGEAISPPAIAPVRVFPVRETGGQIEVAL